MPHLYVIRHGETVDNARSIIQGPRIDGELSERGWQQAGALAEAFAQTPVDRILTSPMQRARQTMAPLLEGTVRTDQTVPELYEMDFGDLCGRHVTEVQDEIEQTLDAWRMGHLGHPFPGGESPLLVQHRLRGIVTRLRAMMAHEDLALIAHGRLNRVLIASLLGWDLRRMDELPQANAAVTHLAWTPGGLELRRLNDQTHLAS